MRLSEMDARDMHTYEPETPVETERSEHLRRHVYKDGHIEWERLPHDPVGYEQDCFEEAYEMGLKASDAQLANLRANAKAGRDQAFADGVFVTAQTVYGGKR